MSPPPIAAGPIAANDDFEEEGEFTYLVDEKVHSLAELIAALQRIEATSMGLAELVPVRRDAPIAVFLFEYSPEPGRLRVSIEGFN